MLKLIKTLSTVRRFPNAVVIVNEGVIMTRFQFVFLSAFLFLVTGHAQVSAECQRFLNELPATYKRGWIQVPENWKNPNSRRIKVFYYTNYEGNKTPAAYFYGGPLGVDHYSWTQFQKHRYAYRQFDRVSRGINVSFVYIDQRGTGCSDAVPIGADVSTSQRTSFYSTDQIVYDAEYIRMQLFGSHARWKVVGQSWGGEIINRYLLMYPNSIISVHNYAGGFVQHFTEFMYNRMAQQQRVTEAFMQRYPSARASFANLKKAIRPDDCIEAVNKNQVCGPVLIDALVDFYLGEVALWPNFNQDLPKYILSNGRVDVATIKKNSGYVFDYFFSANILSSSIVWKQESPTAHRNGNLAIDCMAAYELLRKNGVDPAQMYTDHCRIVTLAYNKTISDILQKVMPAIPVRRVQTTHDVLAALRNHPRINYYLYSGGLDFYDVQTPIYKKIQSEKQIKYTHFANNGHFGYYDEIKFWQDLVKD